MIHRTSESGRTRLVVTVVLVLLIGGVGAIVVPRLLHEATPPVPSTVRAEICIGVPAGGLPSAGRIRVRARCTGLTPLELVEMLPQGANEEAVLGFLALDAEKSAWDAAARPRVAGNCLSFAAVTAVGGDPGGSGASMAWAVSGRPEQALALRLRVTGGPDEPREDGRVRVSLSARGVIGTDGVSMTRSVALEGRWQTSAAMRTALAAKLREAGWAHATDDEGGVVVLALPENTSIGSAILSVEYPSTPEDVSSYAWSLELLP